MKSGLIKTLVVILIGVFLLAYFRSDIQSWITQPRVKDALSATLTVAQKGIQDLLNWVTGAKAKLDTATTTAIVGQ